MSRDKILNQLRRSNAMLGLLANRLEKIEDRGMEPRVRLVYYEGEALITEIENPTAGCYFCATTNLGPSDKVLACPTCLEQATEHLGKNTE